MNCCIVFLSRTPAQAPTVAAAADPFGLPTPATNTNSGPWGTAPLPEKIQNPTQDIWGPPTTNGAVQHSTDPWGTSNQPISNVTIDHRSFKMYISKCKL